MSFEKEYYESSEFWSEGSLTDISNSTRINETIKLIPSDVKTLLDVGCGNGVFTNQLIKEKPELKVTATDRSLEALSHVLCEKFESDISAINSENSSFDCVVCLQVIEHLPIEIYDIALKELTRVSKKYIIIGVPYNENIKNNFTECPKCLSNFNSDLHLRSFTNNTLENLLKPHGFILKVSTNLIKSSKFVGLDFYLKLKRLFNTRKPPIFNSPICLICGYRNDSYKLEKPNREIPTPKTKGTKTIFKRIIKSIWPTEEVDGYWIIALYEKNSNE